MEESTSVNKICYLRNRDVDLKAFREVILSLLLILLLTAANCNAQSLAALSHNKGVEYSLKGDFTKAKEEFEKSLNIDPSFEPAKLYLKTIRDYHKHKIKMETAIHLCRGISHTTNGQYAQAIIEFTRAIEINPSYAESYNERGVVYENTYQSELAIKDYNKAIEINSKFAIAYNNRGNVYDDRGEYNLAISDFTKSIEINPMLAEVYNNRAFTYYTIGRYERAISDYNIAIEIKPKYALAYNNRGLVYFARGQYYRAIQDYTKAIKINPKLTLAYNNRGYLYLLKLGDKAKGCADFKIACELGECENYNWVIEKNYCP